MSANDRLRELRKELKLSQDDFGTSLGVTGAGISKIENGQRSLTPQMLKLICSEYGVNQSWLTEGNPPMFTDPTADLDINPDVKELTKLYARLDNKDKKVVKELIKSILKDGKE